MVPISFQTEHQNYLHVSHGTASRFVRSQTTNYHTREVQNNRFKLDENDIVSALMPVLHPGLSMFN